VIHMWKKEALTNLGLFIKTGLPYTIAGVAIIFAGIYCLKYFFEDSEYLTALLFLWMALFWSIYQPLFRKKIKSYADHMRKNA
jgi:drug/metabolite transporter (DMT)-like permease